MEQPDRFSQALSNIANLFTSSHQIEHLSIKKVQLTPQQISQMFRVFSEQPYSPDIESLRGLALQSIHKNELALFVYDEVLTRYPYHSPTLRRKAIVLSKMKRQNEAAEALERARMIEPDNLHLQILKQANSIHDDIQKQFVAQKDWPEKQEALENNWVKSLRSIDRPLKKLNTTKSVLFKSNLEQEISSEKKILTLDATPKKSILKTRSNQDFVKLSVQSFQIPTTQFNTTKIKSIDGKMSQSSKNSGKKQVLFCYQVNLKGIQNQKPKTLSRKPSIISGTHIKSSKSTII